MTRSWMLAARDLDVINGLPDLLNLKELVYYSPQIFGATKSLGFGLALGGTAWRANATSRVSK